MKKIKKTIYISLLLLLIFSNSFSVVNAGLFGGGPSIPSFEEIADKAEQRYGFDSNIMRNSKEKADYPEVEVFFNNTSPKNGEKVTATAQPKFFKNSNENLYYTWFLFREDDNLGDADAMEKAKIRAMGMVARGDFDPILFGTDYDVDTDDDDGYEASFGGGDGRGGKDEDELPFSGDDNGLESSKYIDPASKQIVDTDEISRCYKHNFGFSKPGDYSDDVQDRAGADLIVKCEHKFPKIGKFKDKEIDGWYIECDDSYKIGDGEFGVKEEKCWRLDPTNPDTDGDGFIDEADLAGLGQTQLTWTFQEGDRVGVIIEGTSMIAINEARNVEGIRTPIYHQKIDLESGSMSGTADTTTDGGGVSMSGSASVSEDGESAAYSQSSTSSDSTSETDFEGKISFPTTTEQIGVSIEAETNPYHKITWAGLGVCDKEEVEGKDKRSLIKNDECEGTDDYGYTFLATKRVSKASQDLLKTTLSFSPEEPQADKNNPDFSSYIKVKASFTESEIEDGFVYYKWDIFKCTEEQIINDTCSNEGEHLTLSCGKGDVVSDCSNDDLESNSLAEAMGVSEIEFRGSSNFYNNQVFSEDEKIYFKVYLTTKESSDSDQKYISSVDIPIDKNDLKISLLNVDFDGVNNNVDNEICQEGSYKKICPVYNGQILFAVYGGGLNEIKSGYWELDGNRVEPLKGNPFSAPIVFRDNYYAFFPITRSDMTLSSITFRALTENGETVTSERMLSAAEPMILKIANNNSNVWPQTFTDTNEQEVDSESVLLAKIGEEGSIKAEIVPNYLEGRLSDNNLEIKWFLDNKEITTENAPYGITFENEKQILKFDLTGNEGESLNLRAEIIKNFSDKKNQFFKEQWNINKIKDSKKSKSITIIKTNDNPSGAIAKNENSLNLFMASTYQNAPEYFVFIIKTAIILVLFWSLFYGFNQWNAREYKLEK